MFHFWLRKHMNVKNCLTFVCVSLTILLIYKELVTFSVTKPTATSKEEEKLDTSNLPEVVVCLDPGFDVGIMRKYSYLPERYYKGENDNKTFVGWKNGKQIIQKDPG